MDTLLQDYGSSTDVPNAMNSSTGGNRFKKMVYNYDLISGKVNLVAYQPGQKDQFYHQYKYDAENRLTTVLTSKDSLFWEQEARYYYYRHGPLERMVLGQNQVQGLDYAYTLQGWLKTVNSNSVGDGIHDMGQDGFYNADDPYLGTRINSNVARDVYGYMLNYFDGDYEPINIPGINVNVFAVMPTGGLPSSLTGASLYNGNISSMLVNIPALSSNTPYLYGYRYDQLNRIKMMDAFTVTENYNNNYDQSLDIALAQTSDYKERISYDPNGKIVTYGRWGKARQLDSATYNYTTNSNKLNYISDPIGKITDDVGNQSANNYQWDEIGEMTHDADRGLSNATWTVYGKIQSQSLSNGTTINYTYDAGGNRISKTVSGTNGYTEYYVRDASGNTMSVYRAGDNSINSGNLTQTEINLYGSSRLGTYKPNTDVTTVPGNTVTLTDGSIAYLYNFTRGNKFFELTDHRCNNLATISDKKTPIDQNTDGFIDYYLADVVTAQDYSSFGALLDGRQTGNTPRYTYNGKQLDKELGWQEYGMREYLGGSVPVFASVDPLTKAYPWYTPYQFAGNRPIIAIDLDGMEPLDVNTHQPKAELSPTAAENKPASDPTAHGNNIIPWKDLLNFKVPLKLIEGTKGRDVGAIVQDINNATGANTNFDYYTVQINKLPLGIDNGGELFEKIRKNIGYFMDENTEFGGYSNNDRKKWESSNPLGSVMSFDAKFTPLKLNFDDASVITSSYYKNNEGGFWTFSTITSNGDGYHPISGTRQFGVSTIQGNNGISYLFYIRATDRARGGMEAMLQKTVFESAEATWKTVCASVAGYVNEYGGTAQNPSEPISKRIPWNEVKELNKKK